MPLTFPSHAAAVLPIHALAPRLRLLPLMIGSAGLSMLLHAHLFAEVGWKRSLWLGYFVGGRGALIGVSLLGAAYLLTQHLRRRS